MTEKTSCQALLQDLLEERETPWQIQQRLFSRKEFLETVLYQAPDAIVTLDTTYRVVDWNSAAERIFGYSREEACGHELDSLITSAETASEAKCLSRQLLDQQPVVTTETVRFTKAGAPVQVRVSGAPIVTEGKLHGVVAVYTDISERIATEDALREQKRTAEQAHSQWERTFDAVPDLIALIDTNHRIIRTNRAMAERLGRPATELTGCACHTVVHNRETPPAFCPHSQLLDEGDSSPVEITEDNLGGDFLITVTPLHDGEGRLLGSVHIARDITKRKRDEKRLAKMSKEFEQIFHGTQDAMFLVAVEEEGGFRFIRTNKAHQRATGLELKTVRGKTPLELLGEEAGAQVSANYQRCVDAGAPLSYEEELVLPGGTRVWHTTLTPVYEEERITSIVGSAQDITERKRAEEHLRYLATTDELTGLYNRRHFMEILDTEIERAKRYGQSLALISLDIDHFKTINDTHGHAVGDAALEHLAAQLLACKRQPDSLGRLGGEEFALIAPHTDRAGATELAERIRSELERTPIELESTSLHPTISLGVTALNVQDNDTIDALLKRADDALYEAKRTGRNRTVTS